MYLVDTGYGIFGAKDIARDMENAVFLGLFRWASGDPTRELYYLKGQNYEVDSLLVEKGKVTELMQVSYSLEDRKTRMREVRSLLKASRVVGCDKLTVLTCGEEELEWWGLKGRVRFVPLWKWLLGVRWAPNCVGWGDRSARSRASDKGEHVRGFLGRTSLTRPRAAILAELPPALEHLPVYGILNFVLC